MKLLIIDVLALKPISKEQALGAGIYLTTGKQDYYVVIGQMMKSESQAYPNIPLLPEIDSKYFTVEEVRAFGEGFIELIKKWCIYNFRGDREVKQPVHYDIYIQQFLSGYTRKPIYFECEVLEDGSPKTIDGPGENKTLVGKYIF